jgi:putative toxin-antitoxin system antitoxin component (TIGR02293 family)
MPTASPPRALGWSLGLRARSTSDVVRRVEGGFPLSTLGRIQALTGLSEAEIADLISASTRTLARRRLAGRLAPAESDRLYRVARLFERAVEVFGGDELAIEEARQWLRTPAWALGEATPLAYARTETGAREVEALLGRIDYGVLS